MTLYAEDTAVPIHRSRDEIVNLLQKWGAKQVHWADDYEKGAFLLRFLWSDKTGQSYQARVVVKLQPKAQLEAMARRGGRSYAPVSPGKLEKLMAARGRREHRVLLLWLKGAFNAIELGIITAEELFLPWMEGQDGKTVAEVALPNIGKLLSSPGQMFRMLPSAAGNR